MSPHNHDSSPRASIGIFGGSGFYSFLTDVEEVRVHTPYGPASDRFSLATLGGKRVPLSRRSR